MDEGDQSSQNMVIVFKIDDAQNPEEPPPAHGVHKRHNNEDRRVLHHGLQQRRGLPIVTNTQLLLTSADGFVERDFHLGHSVPGLRSTGLRWLSHTDTWFIEAYSDETRVKSLDQIGDPESQQRFVLCPPVLP